jgi:uncharacterized protein with von Willebrand factor type A (vWA) domain
MASGDAIVGHVVTFGRVLQEAGLEIGPGRVTDALRALDAVDLARRDDVYFSLRQTLVSRHDQLAVFDRAFEAWFLRAPVAAPQRVPQPEPVLRVVAADSRSSSTVPRWWSERAQSIVSATPGGLASSRSRTRCTTCTTWPASASETSGARDRTIWSSRSRPGCSIQW